MILSITTPTISGGVVRFLISHILWTMGSSSACHDFAADNVESPLLLPVSRSNHNGDPAQRRPVVAATRHARPDLAPLTTPSAARASCLLTLGRSLFLLINIGAWYFTNGLNGIAMQSYSADLVKSREEDDTFEHLPLVVAMLATLVVSSLQLLAGAILGLLLIYLQLLSAGETQHFSTEVQETLSLFPNDQAMTILGLSLLHAGGSFCTNAGFMFGKASLIQTIKLLEPFKTLMFAKLLAPEEGKLVTIGVLCSISTTVMAAISLVQSYSTPPNPLAIFFAVNSGLLLSCRNVLQRREHNLKSDSSSPTETGTVSIVRHDAKLKKSLQQFTRLSLRSGLLLSLVAAIARILSLFLGTNPYATFHVGEQYTWGMVIWHPLYNAFSMITLGYTSAVTHALLNAGKRVFAILLALVWFGEDVSPVTCTALVLVLIGGFWYTHETKAAASAQKISSSPSTDGATSKAAARAGWWKAVIAALLLHSLAIARSLEPVAKT
jgi:Triose-phosphate Transporter family